MEEGRVECRAEYTYPQRPTAVWWAGQRLAVTAVETEWRIPQGKAFRVCCEDGKRFELFFLEGENRWLVNLL